MKINNVRDLEFSDQYIDAYLIENVKDFIVPEGIVVNLSNEPIIIGAQIESIVPAWKSVVVFNANIVRAARIAIIRVRSVKNLGGLSLSDNWEWFGNRLEKFPRNSPLYISKYDTVGTIKINPYTFTKQEKAGSKSESCSIRINLWWAPAETDCSMHNEHPFLEIHTQIHGSGRIQKFRERDESTKYEEMVLAPGHTHDPFFFVNDDGDFVYPWHRYYSDNDCIWLAIELHPG
ncbi:hypothetical protein [Glaciimonas sp. PCH181]|uniref:hypothetical protein n=1 Tax=Glaciimonas sp. PCH181 TaxID=2133943 RepID=UPI000D3A6EFB|nr:hypothetical protein [Glaciimonas sp. PCH181]PUA18429.1 hypothetical protein C7W93_00185 [Glaciimonas sp. PCH181]